MAKTGGSDATGHQYAVSLAVCNSKFSMAQAIENEGAGKAHFPVPFQERHREGRLWMLTRLIPYNTLNPRS